MMHTCKQEEKHCERIKDNLVWSYHSQRLQTLKCLLFYCHQIEWKFPIIYSLKTRKESLRLLAGRSYGQENYRKYITYVLDSFKVYHVAFYQEKGASQMGKKHLEYKYKQTLYRERVVQILIITVHRSIDLYRHSSGLRRVPQSWSTDILQTRWWNSKNFTLQCIICHQIRFNLYND